jgi:hypothetical protein
MPIQITPETEAKIVELWQQGASRDDICRACGLGVEAFLRARKQLALPPRPLKTNSGRRGVDPKPREIRAACRRIQKTWSVEETAIRQGYPALAGDHREAIRGHRIIPIGDIVAGWEQ